MGLYSFTQHLKTRLRTLFFVEQQLRDTQGLYPVHNLNVVKPSAQTDMAVNALAHPQRQCPVLSAVTHNRDVCGMNHALVLWGEPRDNGLIIFQQSYCIS